MIKLFRNISTDNLHKLTAAPYITERHHGVRVVHFHNEKGLAGTMAFIVANSHKVIAGIARVADDEDRPTKVAGKDLAIKKLNQSPLILSTENGRLKKFYNIIQHEMDVRFMRESSQLNLVRQLSSIEMGAEKLDNLQHGLRRELEWRAYEMLPTVISKPEHGGL